MITRLTLKNFRRHPDTDISFSPGDQLIAVTGNNGMGKSTLIVEALLFAFFGESRHGRRNLDGLVMRGAELVGCEVVVEFVIDAVAYRVERRRAERVTSAVLYGDGSLVASTPSAVDAEMTRLLGLDAAGFKLAVLAKQKELDGLVALDRRQRRMQVGRLLRLDALARSATDASRRYSDAANLSRALGSVTDLSPLEAEVADAEATVVKLEGVVAATRAELDQLDGVLLSARPVVDAFNAANAANERAAGALTEARAALAAARSRCDAAVVPHPPVPPRRASVEVSDDISTLSSQLAAARADEQVLADMELLEADLAACERDLAAAEARNAAASAAVLKLGEHDAVRAQRAAEVDAAAELLAEARERRATAAAAVSAAAVALEQAQRLDALCPECGQVVAESHRRSLLERADADAARAQAERSEAEGRVAECASAHAAAVAELAVADQVAAELAAHAALFDQAAQDDLAHRRNSYLLRLSRPRPSAVAFDQLEGRLGELNRELRAAREAERLLSEVAAAQARATAAGEVLAAAQARLADAEAAYASSTPPASLVEAAQAALADLARRNELVLAAAGLDESLALARRARVASQGRLDAAVAQNERVAAASADAHVWALTKAVLSDTHATLSAGLRPSLTAALSAVLSRLSDGRFESVTIDEDFEVRVFDGGEYRSLADCSGGETDLVALALRLALSQLISESVAGNRLGVLVLDEVFGSQDPSRRSAILEALRELRGVYQQIFIVSHVGGLDEASDLVLEISSGDGGTATVTQVP